MDFAKAFDHTDHKILLRELYSMEAPPIIIKWIGNFLTEREQRVKIGPYVSERLKTKWRSTLRNRARINPFFGLGQ